MVAIIVASLGLHAALVGTAVMSGYAAPAPQQEVAVDLVTEMPKADVSKPEMPKAEVPKPETPKPEARADVPDAAKPAPELKPALPDAPAATTETPAKIEEAKAEPPKGAPDRSQGEQSKAEPPAAADTQRSLERELDALKAEHAALEAARAAQDETEVQKAPRAPVDTALGPLPDSFQAVALPATSDAAEEVASYQQIVFSQLAKAKEVGRRQGLPGSAGVHFSIDEAGRLLDVAIVHKSGVASLDAEALSIVRLAAPFPPPPQGAQRSFDANVNFVVESAR